MPGYVCIFGWGRKGKTAVVRLLLLLGRHSQYKPVRYLMNIQIDIQRVLMIGFIVVGRCKVVENWFWGAHKKIGEWVSQFSTTANFPQSPVSSVCMIQRHILRIFLLYFWSWDDQRRRVSVSTSTCAIGTLALVGCVFASRARRSYIKSRHTSIQLHIHWPIDTYIYISTKQHHQNTHTRVKHTHTHRQKTPLAALAAPPLLAAVGAVIPPPCSCPCATQCSHCPPNHHA